MLTLKVELICLSISKFSRLLYSKDSERTMVCVSLSSLANLCMRSQLQSPKKCQFRQRPLRMKETPSCHLMVPAQLSLNLAAQKFKPSRSWDQWTTQKLQPLGSTTKLRKRIWKKCIKRSLTPRALRRDLRALSMREKLPLSLHLSSTPLSNSNQCTLTLILPSMKIRTSVRQTPSHMRT